MKGLVPVIAVPAGWDTASAGFFFLRPYLRLDSTA
jgi:hypothetical protein